jgi:superfamily II DNA or RNA helicase
MYNLPYIIERVISELRTDLEQRLNKQKRLHFRTIRRSCGLRQNNQERLELINIHLKRNDIIASTNSGTRAWNGDVIGIRQYITFELRDNLMQTYNDYPDITLLDKHINKSKSILLAVAYLDEVMIDHLVNSCKEYDIKLRVVCDYNYNSNIYTCSRIRAKVESVGEFRTSAGRNNEGIMHTKIYVFYLHNDQITTFNTSANFTANAWKSRNIESPVTVQIGDNKDSQLLIMLNTAEEIWKMATEQNPRQLSLKDKVVHKSRPELGKGIIYEIELGTAEVKFGRNVENVKLADLELVVDPLQMLKNGEINPKDNLYKVKAKFLANYIYAQNGLTGEFTDFKIDPVPHQLLSLKKIIESEHGGNMLFADDVGLGKTIEAGLVINDVLTRKGDNARVLILVPAGLKWQWQEEMYEKFGKQFGIWGSDDSARIFSNGTGSKNLLIASQQKAAQKDWIDAIMNNITPYDLIVIDECHRVAGEDVNIRKLVNKIREKNCVKQFLLLSATPHSGKPDRFLNLLNILDKSEFPKGDKTKSSIEKIEKRPDIVQRYIYRNDKLTVTDFERKPLFKDIVTNSVFVKFTDEEKAFSTAVMKYIYAYYQAQQEAQGNLSLQIGFVGTIYRKMLASSWRSLYRSILARYNFLQQEADSSAIEPLADEEEIDEKEERYIEKLIKDMKQKEIYTDEKRDLRNIIRKAEVLKEQKIDSKISKLLAILNLPENINDKFLIFTQYVKTLDVIKEALGKKNTAEIQGSIDPIARRREVEKFRDGLRFMISTEAGGEGINLQFAHKVINFDIPWNPARLQQRIGRVWRYGQTQDVVVYNFYVEESEDDNVLRILDERMDEIINIFITPVQFPNIPANLKGALLYDLKMKVLGEMQDVESFVNEMGLLSVEMKKQRQKDLELNILKAYELVKNNDQLSAGIGVELENLKGFYASRDIPYLKFFAEAFAKSLNGTLFENESIYKFEIPSDMLPKDIEELNSRQYTFAKDKQDKDKDIRYFGFGDSNFNAIMSLCRRSDYGGLLAYFSIPLFLSNSQACLMATTITMSPVTDTQDSESYPLTAFVSVPDGNPIAPEDLFKSEWEGPSVQAAYNFNENLLQTNIRNILNDKNSKLKAIRNKEFNFTNINIESVVANSKQ